MTEEIFIILYIYAYFHTKLFLFILGEEEEKDLGDKIADAFDMGDCYCGSAFNTDNLDCLVEGEKCVSGCVQIIDSW